jgi:hypothetical protein
LSRLGDLQCTDTWELDSNRNECGLSPPLQSLSSVVLIC